MLKNNILGWTAWRSNTLLLTYSFIFVYGKSISFNGHSKNVTFNKYW